MGDLPVASTVSTESFTLRNGDKLHLSLNVSTLTIRAYYSHKPYRMTQTFSAFPNALEVEAHKFSPTVAQMFEILKQLATANNGTMLNVNDAGEITANFEIFGGAEAKLTLRVCSINNKEIELKSND